MILYINTEYGNEATLNVTMDDEIDSFGDLTWREFIENVRSEDISNNKNLDEWLLEEYKITSTMLDEKIDSETVNRYYSDLSYYQDNTSGGNVQAFSLIRSLQLFPMDQDGNGSGHGVELYQSTANGPRKFVFISDVDAANWLVDQAAIKGVQLVVVFK